MKLSHTISLGFFLISIWLLLSGHYNPLFIFLGIGSVIFILYLVRRMDVVDHESHPIHINPFALIGYWLWLLKEIFLSNLAVCRAILSPTLNLSPSTIKVTTSQKTSLGQVIYANSITLTPGTVTLDIDDKSIQVHSLMTSQAEGLHTGEMDKRVTQLERLA